MGTGENSLPGLQRLGLMNELRGFCCAAPTAAAACPDEQDGHSPALLLSSLLSSSEGFFPSSCRNCGVPAPQVSGTFCSFKVCKGRN